MVPQELNIYELWRSVGVWWDFKSLSGWRIAREQTFALEGKPNGFHRRLFQLGSIAISMISIFILPIVWRVAASTHGVVGSIFLAVHSVSFALVGHYEIFTPMTILKHSILGRVREDRHLYNAAVILGFLVWYNMFSEYLVVPNQGNGNAVNSKKDTPNNAMRRAATLQRSGE